jgi:hypothetical protein
MLKRSQDAGEVKAGPTTLLMELVFGAFNAMMSAHWDGRVELSDDVTELAERSCWDIIAERGPPPPLPESTP